MNLHITEAAKAALQRLVVDSGLKEPYVALVAGTDLHGKNWGWNVGLYARDRITAETPGNWIIQIEEFSFLIDSQLQPNLNGKSLDFKEGHFRVR